MNAGASDGDHFFKTWKNNIVKKTPYLFRRLADADGRTDLGAVTTIAGREFHNDDVTGLQDTTGRTRIAKDHRGIFHRRGADDRKIDIATAFENSARRSGLELRFRYTWFTAACQSLHCSLTEPSRFSDAVKFLRALLVDKFVHEAGFKG